MKVLVASPRGDVLDYLHRREDVEVIEALSVPGILANLWRSQLVVMDQALDGASGNREELLSRLRDAMVPVAPSDEFLEDPDRWLDAAIPTVAVDEKFRPKTIAIVSSSGGVGCTTLALDTALEFARQTGRPTLLMDFVQGMSGLSPILDKPLATLWECVEWSRKPDWWRGVTVLPMDFGVSRTIPVDRLKEYLRLLFSGHVLRVLDVKYPHPLLEAVESWVEQWFVVATPRRDAMANAAYLKEMLPNRAATVVLNRAHLGSQLSFIGQPAGVVLRDLGSLDGFDGRLGRQVLDQVFPKWKEEHEPQGFTTRLRHLLGGGGSNLRLR